MTPSTPVTPGTPVTPDTSLTPGTSTTAETPSTSETPGVPGTPTTSGGSNGGNTPHKALPQTNDPTPHFIVGILAALGISVISAGIVLEMGRRGRDGSGK